MKRKLFLLYFLFFLAAQVYAATLIDSYSESNQNSETAIRSGGITLVGNAITLADNYAISSIKWYLKKYNSPSGTVYAEIFACTGTVGSTGKGTGSALATSDGISTASIGSTYALYEFNFSPAYSASAGDIVILCKFEGGDSSNYINVGHDTTGEHAGNRCYYLSGTWYATATWDMCFYLYAESGWSGKVDGVSSPAKVDGIAPGKVDGVS